MKTKKILGIVVLTLVLTLALGVAAYAATEVSDEAGLRAALAVDSLSTTKSAPTEIVLTNDITLTGGVINVLSTKQVYVNISGAYTIKNMQNLAPTAKIMQKDGGAVENGQGADSLFNLNRVTLHIKDAVIDVNYGNDGDGAVEAEYYSPAFALSNNSQLHLDGNAVIKNGMGGTNSLSGSITMLGGAGLYINDNAKITGCVCAGRNLIYAHSYNGDGINYSQGTFKMTGGEISGNVIGGGCLINSVNGFTISHMEISGGKIVDNANTGDYLIKCGNDMKLSGSVKIEGPLSLYYGGVIGITSPIEEGNIIFRGYPDNNWFLEKTDRTNLVMFKGVVDYVMTASDIANIEWLGMPSDRTIALYNNAVYAYSNTNETVPKGAIYLDGSIQGETPPAAADILGLTEGDKTGVAIVGQTEIKYDTAYGTIARFTAKDAIKGAGVLFIPDKVLGENTLDKNLEIAAADAYDAGKTLIEEGAKIQVVAALKSIPREIRGESLSNITLVLRPYIVTIASEYIYGDTSEVTLNFGDTGKVE